MARRPFKVCAAKWNETLACVHAALAVCWRGDGTPTGWEGVWRRQGRKGAEEIRPNYGGAVPFKILDARLPIVDWQRVF
ncbi:MAG: hypothetical protein H7839_15825 [Magnetococcus sp. YQC-5]